MVETATQKRFPCRQCGAQLDFLPGTSSLRCGHCGFENPIPRSEEEIAELDYNAFLQDQESREERSRSLTVKCEACAAETTLPTGLSAASCPFCGSNIVATAQVRGAIKAKSLLPFKVTREAARTAFRSWIGGLWFAPGELKRHAEADGLGGLYVPYWTFDCDATTFYRGERGDDYWITETYTTTEGGQTVTRTRQVQRTRWTGVSGTVWNDFDDVLVLASRTLPRENAEKLEPWDLADLVPYTDDYLSGFRAATYQIDLREGFAVAREIMDGRIVATIEADIGGNHQRIHSRKSRYDRITFKNILLPIWLSAYRYRNKVYRFLVNGRTAEVQGERPWSWGKITVAVLAALAVLGTVAAFFALRGQ